MGRLYQSILPIHECKNVVDVDCKLVGQYIPIYSSLPWILITGGYVSKCMFVCFFCRLQECELPKINSPRQFLWRSLDA